MESLEEEEFMDVDQPKTKQKGKQKVHYPESDDEEEEEEEERLQKNRKAKRKLADYEDSIEIETSAGIDKTKKTNVSIRTKSAVDNIQDLSDKRLSDLREAVSSIDLHTNQIVLFKDEFPQFVKSLCGKKLFGIIDNCTLIQKTLANCLDMYKNDYKNNKTNFPVWSHFSDYFTDPESVVKDEVANDVYQMIYNPDDVDTESESKLKPLLDACLSILRRFKSLEDVATTSNTKTILRWINNMIFILDEWSGLLKQKQGFRPTSDMPLGTIRSSIKSEIFEDLFDAERAGSEFFEYENREDVASQLVAEEGEGNPKPRSTYLNRQFLGLECPRYKSIRPLLWAIQEAGTIISNLFMAHLIENTLVDEFINKRLLIPNMSQQNISILNAQWREFAHKIYTTDDPSTLSQSRRLKLESGLHDFWIASSFRQHISNNNINGTSGTLPNGNVWAWKQPNKPFQFIEYLTSIMDKVPKSSSLNRNVALLFDRKKLIFNIDCDEDGEQIGVITLIEKISDSFKDNRELLEDWEDAMLNRHGSMIEKLNQAIFTDPILSRTNNLITRPNPTSTNAQKRNEMASSQNYVEFRTDPKLIEEMDRIRAVLASAVKTKTATKRAEIIQSQIANLPTIHKQYLPRATLSERISLLCIKITTLFDDIYGFKSDSGAINFSTFMNLLLEDYQTLRFAIDCIEDKITGVQENKRHSITEDILSKYKNINTKEEEILVIHDIARKLKIKLDDVASKQEQNHFLIATRFAHLTLDCALGHAKVLLNKIIKDTALFDLNRNISINSRFPSHANKNLLNYKYLFMAAYDSDQIDNKSKSNNSKIWWDEAKIKLLSPLITPDDQSYSDDFEDLLKQINSLLIEYSDVAYSELNDDVIADYRNVLKNNNIVLDLDTYSKVRSPFSVRYRVENLPKAEQDEKEMKLNLYEYVCTSDSNPSGDIRSTSNNGSNSSNSNSTITSITKLFCKCLANNTITQIALANQHYIDLTNTFNNLISEFTVKRNVIAAAAGNPLPTPGTAFETIYTAATSICSTLLWASAGIFLAVKLTQWGLTNQALEVNQRAWHGRILYTATGQFNLTGASIITGHDNENIDILSQTLGKSRETLINNAGIFEIRRYSLAALFVDFGATVARIIDVASPKPVLNQILQGAANAVINPIDQSVKAYASPSWIKLGYEAQIALMLINAGLLFASAGITVASWASAEKQLSQDAEQIRKKVQWVYGAATDVIIILNLFNTITTILTDVITYSAANADFITVIIATAAIGSFIISRVLGSSKKGGSKGISSAVNMIFGSIIYNTASTSLQLLTYIVTGYKALSFFTNPTIVTGTLIGLGLTLFVGSKIFQKKSIVWGALSRFFDSIVKITPWLSFGSAIVNAFQLFYTG